MSVDRGRRRRHLSSVHVPPCADRFTRYARSTGRYRGLLKGHPPGVSSSVSFSTTDFLATWIFGVFAYFFVVFVVFRSFFLWLCYWLGFRGLVGCGGSVL